MSKSKICATKFLIFVWRWLTAMAKSVMLLIFLQCLFSTSEISFFLTPRKKDEMCTEFKHMWHCFFLRNHKYNPALHSGWPEQHTPTLNMAAHLRDSLTELQRVKFHFKPIVKVFHFWNNILQHVESDLSGQKQRRHVIKEASQASSWTLRNYRIPPLERLPPLNS